MVKGLPVLAEAKTEQILCFHVYYIYSLYNGSFFYSDGSETDHIIADTGICGHSGSFCQDVTDERRKIFRGKL